MTEYTGTMVLEFDLADSSEVCCSLTTDATLQPEPNVRRRELLVYTVLHSSQAHYSLSEYVAASRQVLFADPVAVERVIWSLAERDGSASYWMLAYLEDEQIQRFILDGILTREQAFGMKVLPEDPSACMLLKLPFHHALHVSRWTGVGHMPGFRFLAVPEGSAAEQVFQRVFSQPEAFRSALDRLCWEQNWFLTGSLLEVKCYGVEDRDHLAVATGPHIGKAEIRDVLHSHYRQPYGIVSLSAREFAEWELSGTLPEARLNGIVWC